MILFGFDLLFWEKNDFAHKSNLDHNKHTMEILLNDINSDIYLDKYCIVSDAICSL